MAIDTQIDLAREAEFTLGGVTFRPSTLEAIAGERREVFEPRIMQVLVALVRRKGDVVARDVLIRECWAGRSVGEDSISRCIARLRRYAAAEGSFTLETIPRVGYRLLELETPEQTTRPAAALDPAKSRFRPDRRAIAILVAVLVLLGAGAFWYASVSDATKIDFRRVAVLPFDTLSSGDDARFFGDGVAEQIIAVLNDNQVQAVTRAKSATLRGTARDDAAGKLGVDFILDGTVQRGAAGLRVTVHLDHASTHATVWSASFDQAGNDLLSLQAQVAALAVDEVKSALRARKHGPIDDAALVAYLKSQEYARLGGKTATMQRRDLLREVVTHAPSFPLGYSALAVTTAQLARFVPPREADALKAQARNAALRALELEPRNGEAYLALAVIAPAGDLPLQERLFKNGLAVQPDEPTLNSTYAVLLADEGRLKEALAFQQRAVMLDPLSPRKTAGLAQFLALTGRVSEARATIERAAKLWPGSPGVWLTRVYIAVFFGSETDARVLLDAPQRAPAGLEPSFFNAARATIDAYRLNTPAAKQTARRAILAAVDTGSFEYGGAVEALARMGEIDAAFELAQSRYADRTSTKLETAALFYPTTAALRSDPRFRGLMERLRLPQVWSSARVVPDFCATEDVPVCRDLQRS